MQSTDCVHLSVPMNEVTLADKMKWGVQAILAPHQLENLVPLYAYPSGDMNIEAFIDALSQDIRANDFFIGLARSQNQQGHEQIGEVGIGELDVVVAPATPQSL